MIASPYDGASRRPLRVVLALIAAADTIALTVSVASNSPRPISHPLAPGFLLALGGHPARVAPIALLGLFGLLRFATRASAIGPGLLGLASLALLCEAHAALIEGPMRIFFVGGATLLGWIAGLGYARLLGHPRDESVESERLAELGAVAALSATYVGAVTSKLLTAGFSWADANSLRSIVFSQRGLPGGSPLDAYAWAVATHPSLAWALAGATMIIQLSAIVYPLSPRARAVCGTLLLCFHLNVWLLTPILFMQSMIFLVAFSYPWPRWIARLRGKALPVERPAEGPSRARVRQATQRAAAFVVALAAVVAVLPIRAYTSLHHHRSSFAAPSESPAPTEASAGPEVRAWLDSLKEGDDLGGFRVKAIRGPRDGAIDVQLARGAARFEISVIRHGSRPLHAPLQVGAYDLLYGRFEPAGERVPEEDVIRALGALGERLKRTEGRPPPAGL